jgi:hypothetical protein
VGGSRYNRPGGNLGRFRVSLRDLGSVLKEKAMGLFEAVIRALIYLCVVALCYYLIIWVLGALGFALPHMVLTILGVIFILVAILILVRLLWPVLGNITLFPPR